MGSVIVLLRRYPFVTATLVVGLVGVLLWMLGATSGVQWLFSGLRPADRAIQFVGMAQAPARALGPRHPRGHRHRGNGARRRVCRELVIVLMLTGGEALEDYAAGRAKRELNALLEKSPQIGAPSAARRLDRGDPGHRGRRRRHCCCCARPRSCRSTACCSVELPEGGGVFDESSLTGESMPVQRSAGDGVLSGAVNGQAAVQIRASATAENSQYQRIVALVAEASESKAPVVRLADRYAVPFTLFALAVAGAAWAISGDPVRFAEVLVVATPCPLLIAAPVAFMGGMSRAARNGVDRQGRRGAGDSSPAHARSSSTRRARSPTARRAWPRCGRSRGSPPTRCWRSRHPPSSTPRTCSPPPSCRRPGIAASR